MGWSPCSTARVLVVLAAVSLPVAADNCTARCDAVPGIARRVGTCDFGSGRYLDPSQCRVGDGDARDSDRANKWEYGQRKRAIAAAAGKQETVRTNNTFASRDVRAGAKEGKRPRVG